MEEIKDENRIITKILNGEMTFSGVDIKNLATADLSEDQEDQIKQLAKDMLEVVEQNKNIRKEVKNHTATVEADKFTKIDLLAIESEIRELQGIKKKNNKNISKNLMFGVLSTLVFGIALPVIVSFFTNSQLLLMITLLCGVSLGIAPCVIHERKMFKEVEHAEEKIRELEQERLSILGYETAKAIDVDLTKKQNIVKHDYRQKDLDEEAKNTFLF